MELHGKVIAAMPERSGVSQRSGNAWKSREYVLETFDENPRHMAFTVFGEERLKSFDIHYNDEVTVRFDIDANEFNGRWYNNIRAYNVVKETAAADNADNGQYAVAANAAPAPSPAPAPAAAPAPAPAPVTQGADNGEADKLPF